MPILLELIQTVISLGRITPSLQQEINIVVGSREQLDVSSREALEKLIFLLENKSIIMG